MAKELKQIEYRNWVKGGLALKLLKDAVEDFVNGVVEKEHEKLIHKVMPSNSAGAVSCSQCILKTLKPYHGREVQRKCRSCPRGQKNCNCLRLETRECPHNICDILYDEILSAHGSLQPNWSNTDVRRWTSSPWEVAKRYINTPGYDTKEEAAEIDISGLLHLLINNTHYQDHFVCQITLLGEIRDFRNNLFHSPTMALNESQLKAAVDKIICLLEDEKELKSMDKAQCAVKMLRKLLEDDFIIKPKTEEDICKYAMDVVNQKELELQQTIQEVKDSVAASLSEAKVSVEEVKVATLNLQDEMDHLKERVKVLEAHHLSTSEEMSTILEKMNRLQVDVESLHRQKTEQKTHYDKVKGRKDLQSNLRELYNRHYVKASVSPLKQRENNINIEDVYVEPVLKHDGQDENDVNDYTEIFGTKHELKKRIYILGDVGSGKSSFCQMMISNWCKSFEVQCKIFEEVSGTGPTYKDLQALRQFGFVFYVPLQSLESSGDLKETICVMYKNEDPSDVIEDVLSNIPEQCLVIADGLDEWVPGQHKAPRQHVTQGLPDTDSFKEVTVLTTSRPSAPGLLKMKSSEYDLKLWLHGIDKHLINDLATKYIIRQNKDSMTVDVLKKLHALEIQHIERTPLLVQHIIWLLCNSVEAGNSTSEIYCSLTNLAIRWYEQKHRSRKIEVDQSVVSAFAPLSLPEQFDKYPSCRLHSDLIFAIGKVAFDILTKGSKKVFGRSTLQANGIYDQLIDEILAVGFLTEENRFDPSAEDTQFEFTHTSFLEFFAALYIASHSRKDVPNENELMTLLGEGCSVGFVLQLENVLILVCGLAPNMTFSICQYIYATAKEDESFSLYRKEWHETQFYDQTQFGDEYRRIAKVCQILVMRCVSECKKSCTSMELKVPLLDIVVGYDYHTFKSLITEHIVPGSVRHLVVKDIFGHPKKPENELETLMKFDELETISVEWFSLSHGELTFLASYITKTETLKHIHMTDISSPGHRLRHPYSEEIDLSNHINIKTVNICSRLLRLRDINTEKLKACILDGAKMSFTGKASKLSNVKISYTPLRHGEISTLTEMLSRSVSLKTIKIWGVSCSDHEEGCSDHVADLSQHDQLERLEFMDNQSVHFRSINTSQLRYCATDRKDIVSELNICRTLRQLELSDIQYTKKENEILITLENLQTLKLQWAEVEENALAVTPELKCLTCIKLPYVKMSPATWQNFVLGLSVLDRSVTVKRRWPLRHGTHPKRSPLPKQTTKKLRHSLSLEQDDTEAEAREFVAAKDDMFQVLGIAEFGIPSDLSSFKFRTLKK